MACCEAQDRIFALQTQINRPNLNLVEPTALAFAIDQETLTAELANCCGCKCIPKSEYAAAAAYVRLYPNRLEWNDPAIMCQPCAPVIPRAWFGCGNFLTKYKDRINVIHFDQPFSNVAAEPGCCENTAWYGCCGSCSSMRNVYIGSHPPVDCCEFCCGSCRNCCASCCSCPGQCCACCDTTVLRGAAIHGNIQQANLPFALLPALKEPRQFIEAYNNVHAKFRAQFPMVEVVMTR